MPSLDAPVLDDRFGFFEVAAWWMAELDRLLELNGLPAGTAVGPASALEGGGYLLRVSPTVAWIIAESGLRLAGQAGGVVVDLSSSRVRLRLRGAWPAIFPRLAPVDCTSLDPRFAATLIHTIPVIILKAGDGFDLYVVRSLAESLVDWLMEGAQV